MFRGVLLKVPDCLDARVRLCGFTFRRIAPEDNMTKTTDPAREIAKFCDLLKVGSGERGDVFLAKSFGVEAWSAEFFQILNAYMERTQFILAIVDTMPLDADHRQEIAGHIRTLQKLCSSDVLRHAWNNSSGGLPIVRGDGRAAISSLSPSIQPIVQYPVLDNEEREQILSEVEFVLGKLQDLQLGDRDFIRQALIDGLRQFHFRLERLKWLGWGYTVAGLRDVITAYLTLERGFPDVQANTSAAAIMKHTKGVFSKVRTATGMAADLKDGFDLAELAFKMSKVGGPFITGYLTGSA